jgi:uncharacterized membrane protein
VPHLGYGLVTHASLVASEDRLTEAPAPPKAFARSLAIGAATGGRATAGITAVALSTSARRSRGMTATLARPAGKALSMIAAAGELALDKSGQVPSRLGPSGLPGRILAGAVSAAALARRNGSDPGPQAVVGMAGAVGGAWLGHWWRGIARKRFGKKLTGAFAEDGVVAALAALACLGR